MEVCQVLENKNLILSQKTYWSCSYQAISGKIMINTAGLYDDPVSEMMAICKDYTQAMLSLFYYYKMNVVLPYKHNLPKTKSMIFLMDFLI